MKIAFMGTDEFAVPSLKELSEKHQISLVITKPDKPRGRGRKVTPTPVKKAAQEMGIPVLTPKSLKSNKFLEQISQYDFDMVVLVAYGRLLPEDFICKPDKGCICLHPSKLPEYRGCSPIESAILDGKKKTGVSVFYIGKEFDTGDVISQVEFDIAPDETGGQLRERLSKESPGVIHDAISRINENSVRAIPQDESMAVWAPKLTKEDALILWDEPAEKCRNRVRALNPKPGAFTYYKGKILKILSADIVKTEDESKDPGGIIDVVKNEGLVVKCGKNALLLLQVQPQGKKAMSGGSFVAGYRPEIGEKMEMEREKAAG